jgi:septal ring-binding cell division protein DamX
MLGIRIERFQKPSNFAISESGGPTVVKPPSEPAEEPPEAATAAAAQPQEATPDAPEKPKAEPPTSSEQPPPAPEKPKATEPAPAPKPEPKAAAPAPKPAPEKPAPPPAKKEEAPTFHYAVQVSSSQDKSMAASYTEVLKGKGFASYVEEVDLGDRGRFFRVMVGPFKTEAEAKKARGQLVADSRFVDSYIRYLP